MARSCLIWSSCCYLSAFSASPPPSKTMSMLLKHRTLGFHSQKFGVNLEVVRWIIPGKIMLSSPRFPPVNVHQYRAFLVRVLLGCQTPCLRPADWKPFETLRHNHNSGRPLLQFLWSLPVYIFLALTVSSSLKSPRDHSTKMLSVSFHC